MSRKEWFSIAILIFVLIFAIYRYKNRQFTETQASIRMGTLLEVSLISRDSDVTVVMDSLFSLIDYYEKKFSFYDPEGDLWKINHSDQDSISIDSEFYELFLLAEKYYHKTSGKYDITAAPLITLWHTERTTIPPPDSIKLAMSKVGFNKIELHPEYIIKPVDMKIDLGSIAKGYIVDRAVEFAISKDIDYGYINAGGDIRLFGRSPRKQVIGIRHPRDPRRVIASLSLSDKAVVTSGDYERYFEVDGVRYHHIINPLTGYPVENVFSVTIIAPDATKADILSTVVFLMDPEEAIELISNSQDVEGVIYYQDEDTILSLRTEGIKKYLLE